MRAVLPVLLLVAASACDHIDPAPLYMDVDYQVRCLDCEPRSPDDPKRQIAFIDGELGYQMDCHTSVVDGDDVLSFSVSYDDPENSAARHALEVDRVGYVDGDYGDKCEVSVRERSNQYVGKCGGDAPTPEVPCQIDFEIDDEGVLNGEILCLEIPNEGIATSTRNVVLSDVPGEPDETPAEFTIYGCTGL